MNKDAVAERVAAQLFDAERAVDAALEEVAKLAALLPQARQEAYLAATVGQTVFASTASAVAGLTAVRGDLVQTHGSLAALARRMGLEAVAAGPMDKPKDDRPFHGYGRAAMATQDA